jgi:acetyl-CoA acyltransferase
MNAYIIAGLRSPVGKAPKGVFRFLRPDDLAAQVIRQVVAQIPQLDKEQIDDVIVGNAMPEAEQGLNVGRLISLLALDTDKVPGMTVNRYCSSGLETIALAAARIHAGHADCIVAGGVESMSLIPMGGWRVIPNADIALNHPDWYWGMGLTAEVLANEFNVNREDQDAFALRSHQRALNAQQEGLFTSGIAAITVSETYLDESGKRKQRETVVTMDEGPRADTNADALAKLKPVFAASGTVTAGNSSQTSDGAAFVIVVSEKMLKQLNVQPIARLVSYAVGGVPPRIMGIGPVEAIPKALRLANLSLNQIDLIELNEAFASQSIAVARKLELNQEILNVNGGAIALGHPLGCSGAKLSVQLFNEMKRRNNKYGIVSMCVGAGQGAAGIFEVY